MIILVPSTYIYIYRTRKINFTEKRLPYTIGPPNLRSIVVFLVDQLFKNYPHKLIFFVGGGINLKRDKCVEKKTKLLGGHLQFFKLMDENLFA